MKRTFDKFPWIVEAPVPELARYKDAAAAAILQEYAVWKPKPKQYSFPVQSDHEFFRRLYDRFFLACFSYFEPFTVHQANTRQCWTYVQNSERASPVWHDHLLTSTINGVYYLSVPDPTGGQIWFNYLDRIWKVSPKEGYLYLFPRWLAHRPTPQASDQHRISVNVELLTNECPRARPDGFPW
jgi:hypothetical protein